MEDVQERLATLRGLGDQLVALWREHDELDVRIAEAQRRQTELIVELRADPWIVGLLDMLGLQRPPTSEPPAGSVELVVTAPPETASGTQTLDAEPDEPTGLVPPDGAPTAAALSPMRRRILDELSTGPLTESELAERVGHSVGSTRATLSTMKRAGKVIREDGRWRLS